MRWNLFWTIFLLFCLDGIAGNEIQAVRSRGHVSLDGRLDEASWHLAPEYASFFNAQPGRKTIGRTVVRVLYDEKALYVGIQSYLPPHESPVVIRCPRDGNTYNSEQVEVMLDPGRTGDFYWHFMMNAAGDQVDRTCEQGGILGNQDWNGSWVVRTGHEQDCITYEIAIPWTDFARIADYSGKSWGINICRGLRAGNFFEDSSAAGGKFNVAGAFLSLKGIDIDLSRYRYDFHAQPVKICSAGGGVIDAFPRAVFQNATRGNVTGRIEAWMIGENGSVCSSDKQLFEVGAGETKNLSTRTIHPPEVGRYQLFMRLSDMDDRTIAVSDRTVDVKIVPVEIRLLAPWYRNSIFVSQKLKNVEFEVLSGIAGRLRVSIIDEKKAVHWEKTEPGAARKYFSVPVSSLPYGKHEIRAELLDQAGKRVDFGIFQVPLWKLPYKRGEVWCDREDNWYVDGNRVLFDTGWYGREVWYHDLQPIVFLRKPKAGEEHKYVIDADLCRLSRGAGKAVFREPVLSEEYKEKARGIVREIRDRKGLFAHYIVDEPSSANLSPSAFKDLYDVIREEDPYHPVMMSDSSAGNYLLATDIQGHHPYPRIVDTMRFNDSTRIITSYHSVRKRLAAIPHRVSFIFMRMGFNQLDYGYGPANSRIISYQEMFDQQVMAIAGGIRGLIPYDRSVLGYPESQLGYPVLTRLGNWMLRSIVDKSRSSVTAAGRNVEVNASEYKGDTIIYASNVSMENRTIAFSGLPSSVKKLTVVCENRTIPVADGRFTDEFHPCGGHVYTTGRDPGYESIGSLSERIETAWTQRRKKGNHFFQRQINQAVKISVSGHGSKYGRNRDTTLWHLCDGLETGLWCTGYEFFHWYPPAGEDTAWVQFDLLKPLELTRIVVYSEDASLKCFSLESYHDGKWQEIFKTSQGTVRTECCFAPHRIEKVRIIVPKQTGCPKIMEVEAY